MEQQDQKKKLSIDEMRAQLKKLFDSLPPVEIERMYTTIHQEIARYIKRGPWNN